MIEYCTSITSKHAHNINRQFSKYPGLCIIGEKMVIGLLMSNFPKSDLSISFKFYWNVIQ